MEVPRENPTFDTTPPLMRNIPTPFIALCGGLFTFPFALSAQRLVLTDTMLNQTAGLYVSEMELASGTIGLMTGTAYGFGGPGASGAGYVASVHLDSCDWAQGLFVGWSRTFSDTCSLYLGDTAYLRQDGSILGTTVLADGNILAFGSTGESDRAAMVALLQADGDTLWTTSVRSLPSDAWFADAEQATDGSIYCVGSLRDTLNLTDQFIARLTATGELLWTRTIAMPGSNDDARQCFAQGDTLVVFSFTGDLPGTDTINEGDISVLRVSSAGELLDSRVLALPTYFGYGRVIRVDDGSFFLCSSFAYPQEPGLAECGILHLSAELDTLEAPLKVSYLDDMDEVRSADLVYDDASGTLYIGGTGLTGVAEFGTFVVAAPLAQPSAAWGRLVQDNPILYGGIGLTDDNARVRTLISQFGTGRTYVHSWDSATGGLGPAAACEGITSTWTPSILPWEVEIADAPLVLSEPTTQAYHGLTVGEHNWVADVCPAPPPPDACSTGLLQSVESPAAQVWPNPAAPGELVRFAGRAQVYDALGRLIRTSVDHMAAPEQQGCYLVVTEPGSSLLVVRQ